MFINYYLRYLALLWALCMTVDSFYIFFIVVAWVVDKMLGSCLRGLGLGLGFGIELGLGYGEKGRRGKREVRADRLRVWS